MSREIGSELKPIFVDANGDAKACKLPPNATQLGTTEDGSITAISTATTTSTTVCYISPDSTYWLNQGYSIENKHLTNLNGGTEDPFVGNPEIQCAVKNSECFVIGNNSNLTKQLQASDSNRRYFPVFNLTTASEFINKFRITTRGQNFIIRCERGIYFYSGRQTISHPDVQGGGASRIIITGQSGQYVAEANTVINNDTYVRPDYVPSKPFSFGTGNEIFGTGTNTPYPVTFVVSLTPGYAGLALVYGQVEFNFVNITIGHKDSSGKYIADTITYDDWAGNRHPHRR